jgi:hypothetical protein
MTTKKNQYQIDDDTFIESIKSSKNTHEALKKMGLSDRGGAYKVFNDRCKKLQIDLSHFTVDKNLRKTISDEEIIKSCKENISRMSTLKTLGFNPTTGVNITWIDNHIKQLKISTEHWLGKAHLKEKIHNWSPSKTFEEVFTDTGFHYSHREMKKRLLKSNVLEYKCYGENCGINSWNGKKLSLHLEHINGNSTDNRVENLTLLCPNCHSLTPTFCRKKKKPEVIGLIREDKIQCDCGAQILYESKICKNCFNTKRSTKIVWPEKEILLEMLSKSNYFALGKQLGVSDNAIRKHIKKISKA